MFSVVFFFFKQKTAYEMRISDWSSDVCSSDLRQFVQRPFMQFAKGLLQCSTQLGDLILDCHRRERNDLARDKAISFQPPQALCQCLLSDEIGRASCRERVCQYV